MSWQANSARSTIASRTLKRRSAITVTAYIDWAVVSSISSICRSSSGMASGAPADTL